MSSRRRHLVGLGVLALVALLLLLALTIGIPVPGGLVRGKIETALSDVLNHDVTLNGKLRIRAGLISHVHITDFRISDQDEELVTADSVTGSLGLLDLAFCG